MNPQTNPTPGLGLPQPSFDIGQAPVRQVSSDLHTPGTITPQFGPTGGFGAPTSPAGQLSTPAIATDQQFTTQQPTVVQNSTISQSQDGDESNDGTLDEAWLLKVREIVGRTHGDPYTESMELSKLKAQFIKARYNKDIKDVEGQAQ